MEIWTLLLPALGLALFLEGLPYFISPSALRSYLRRVEQMTDATLRGIGLALMVFGLLLTWWSTR